MNMIIDFYKNLDNLNLIIFWGIIIVIILLLIFSMALISKNKKLKKLVNQEKNSEENEFPIKKEESVKDIIPNNNYQSTLNVKEENLNDVETIQQHNELQTEKQFKAEEHVMEYNNELFALPNLKKADEYVEEKEKYEETPNKKEIVLPTGPYQRNVLREMSLSQTSPIGIINNKNKTENNAQELQDSLNIEKKIEIFEELPKKEEPKEKIIEQKKDNNIANGPKYDYKVTSLKSEIPIFDSQQEQEKIKEKLEKNNSIIKEEIKNNVYYNMPRKTIIEEKNDNAKYLETVKEKLVAAEVPEDIDRTDYELQQEEEAIISYKELMEKKDTIKMIDEEEAVISIDELMDKNKKEEQKKLYNITPDEANDQFINELKNFRNDLK